MPDHDVIIVGGGIQGVMAALECARRGRRPLLIERDVIGSGATGNSFGIVHGGFRYLQSLDLARWCRSRRAQLSLHREFTDFIGPLRCVMPLYRGCIRSRTLFRSAFAIQALARYIKHLDGKPDGVGFLSVAETRATFPVPERGLLGSAFWDELVLKDIRGLLRAATARVTALGGTIYEHEEVVKIVRKDAQVTGVFTQRAGSRSLAHHKAPVVLACGGNATRDLVQRSDLQPPPFTSRVLAFNLLLDFPIGPEAAIAVSERPGRGRSLFLRPYEGRLLAGTAYVPMPGRLQATIHRKHVDDFLNELRRAAPILSGARVAEVWPGHLPDDGKRKPRLRDRDIRWDHGRHGGPSGLYTLMATKLTTAQVNAEEAVSRIWPDPVSASKRRGASWRLGDRERVEFE